MQIEAHHHSRDEVERLAIANIGIVHGEGLQHTAQNPFALSGWTEIRMLWKGSLYKTRQGKTDGSDDKNAAKSGDQPIHILFYALLVFAVQLPHTIQKLLVVVRRVLQSKEGNEELRGWVREIARRRIGRATRKAKW